MTILTSKVPGHEGPCRPVWVNANAVCHRLDRGVTGFFRLVEGPWWWRCQFGPEFHGIVRDGAVHTTAGMQ